MAELLGSGAGDLSTPQVIVSFKAGKMNRERSLVTADPRRGRLELVLIPEDSLTHLHWRPRGSSTAPEDDHILFPGDAEFVRVRSSPDRVYVLKWRSSDKRLFFWMQHANADDDEGYVDAINARLTENEESEVTS